jgi:ferric-dicitrate binding protein FerR (iron transport regulator)
MIPDPADSPDRSDPRYHPDRSPDDAAAPPTSFDEPIGESLDRRPATPLPNERRDGEPVDADTWHLITRAVTGQLTDADQRTFRQQLDANPEWRRLYEELSAVWEHAERPAFAWDVPAALERIKRHRTTEVIPIQTAHRMSSTTARPGRPRWPVASQRSVAPWAATAAAVVAAVLGATIWWHGSAAPPSPPPAPIALEELRAEPRQRATLTLSDGTRIVLAPGSVLRYAPHLDTPGRREVQLDGEAYFEVVHDAARPFVVHTAHATARDLGTKFVVRAFADHPRVEVIVADGAVALQALGPRAADDTDRTLVLGPADRGRVDATGRLTLTHGIDVEPELAWTRGHLAFVNTPLREVLPRFNRWFDVEVHLGDSTLATDRFTATFADETSTQAVQILAAALSLRVVSAGRALILYPARRATAGARPPE